jgi:hypothetical protein
MAETDRAAACTQLDSLTEAILRTADSMKDFAEGDPTYVFGEWRDWRAACQLAGRRLDPSEFKSKAHGRD